MKHAIGFTIGLVALTSMLIWAFKIDADHRKTAKCESFASWEIQSIPARCIRHFAE